MIQKFRKKPVVIEATKYDGTNGRFLNEWSNGKVIESPILEPSEDYKDGRYVQIKTIDTDSSWATEIIGDWVIKGTKGEFYPCKPDIFELTYEILE